MPAPLEALNAYPQFILYRQEPRPGSDKLNKIPINYATGTPCNAHDNTQWLHRSEAETLGQQRGAGIGFVLTANDPFFCLDLDGCIVGNQWSPLALELIQRLPGAALERSISGKGLHLWGCYTGPAPAHGKKNTALGIEFYTERRFIALGAAVQGDASTDCTEGLASIIADYFPSGTSAALSAAPPPPPPSSADDEALIERMLSAKPSAAAAFGFKATFADLWQADEIKLAAAYPSSSDAAYDASSADAALATHLAYWTGGDAERIERLMWRSGLARDKWRRRDYLPRTIAAAREIYQERDSQTINSRNSRNSSSNDWNLPYPLTAKIEPEPYPLDALPPAIRAAVEEVADFVKAPEAMVASSALATLSLACQAHADAKRAEKLHGPVGLFLLTIADSGERKSTCDGFFTRAIRDHEEAQAEAAKPALKDHKAAIAAWEAKCGGVKESIRQLAKSNKPTAGMESALRDLEHDKPEPPRIPRLLYADVTPEALAYGLAKQWPSGGVVSAEAGIVFGSHGMGKDSVMRNLGLLNQLWDGTSLTIDRRSTESFTVRGARLTVALQVQEPTLREFFTRSGALARGTGFLARFLVAWPESTQGQRLFTDPPANWPHLAAFHRRIAEILEQPAPIDDDGALTPPLLPLTPEAKAAWVEYHDSIERELSTGGDLYDVRDVASKSADNAARLAALFQMYMGAGGAIGLDGTLSDART